MRVRACFANLMLLAAIAGGGCSAAVPLRVQHDAMVQIGGVPQRILVRGSDPANPPLVIVHGGPGTNENPLFRHYTPALESHYLVVYWEQRGTGRSYASSLDARSMTIDRFTRDLGEVVAHVRKKYHAGKVTLLAHSWGTIPAARYAMDHPDDVRAYVGVGQAVDFARGELLSWQWALDAARATQPRAVEELERIGAPPHNVKDMLKTRRWVERLGGTFHQPLHTRHLLMAALRDPDTGLKDLWLFGKGNQFSLDALWPELRQARLQQDRWQVPLVFVLGRHDHVTPPELAVHYFDAVRAPCKKVVWFEQSAHNAPFEQPQAFEHLMNEELPRWLDACVPTDDASPGATLMRHRDINATGTAT